MVESPAREGTLGEKVSYTLTVAYADGTNQSDDADIIDCRSFTQQGKTAMIVGVLGCIGDEA